MTWDERVAAVAAQTRGLTDRQAAFLVTVMLHAGVCVLRQYSTFTAMSHGRKIADFFRLLLDRRYATAQSCRHNRAHIFHIHYKPLYAAIGEPGNRHRKSTPLPRAIERLMVLDAVLADPGQTWLATEQDKLAHFMLTQRNDQRRIVETPSRGATERKGGRFSRGRQRWLKAGLRPSPSPEADKVRTASAARSNSSPAG